MKKLDVERRKVDARALKFRGAQATDFEHLVEESVDVVVDGALGIAFRVLPAVPPGLLEACQAIAYQETARTDGLVTQSRTLGSLPRVTLRRDFCTKASMATQHPAEHAVFCRAAAAAAKVYRDANPASFERQEQEVARVLSEWRLPGAPAFTSGIVNKNNSLRYHCDSGNFKGLWSAMYAFSFDTTGGELVVPELGLAFSFARPALILFDGAANIHGVTPIVRKSSMSYRYSIVFYAMKQLCNCLPAAGELQRIRQVKTRREIDRAAGKKV